MDPRARARSRRQAPRDLRVERPRHGRPAPRAGRRPRSPPPACRRAQPARSPRSGRPHGRGAPRRRRAQTDPAPVREARIRRADGRPGRGPDRAAWPACENARRARRTSPPPRASRSRSAGRAASRRSGPRGPCTFGRCRRTGSPGRRAGPTGAARPMPRRRSSHRACSAGDAECALWSREELLYTLGDRRGEREQHVRFVQRGPRQRMAERKTFVRTIVVAHDRHARAHAVRPPGEVAHTGTEQRAPPLDHHQVRRIALECRGRRAPGRRPPWNDDRHALEPRSKPARIGSLPSGSGEAR